MKYLFILFLTISWASAQIPGDCSQAVIGNVKNWNSSHVSLTLYEKQNQKWQAIGKTWQGRLGSKGLAWGLGIHPMTNSPAPVKKEGDQRAPAGIFRIGGAYGYADRIARHPQLSYRRITPQDLWVEDPKSPHYNKHIVIGHLPKTNWEQKAQMRQNDYAHSLKLYIGHNDAILGGQPIAGLGSAIFFHIWRGNGSKATAGCTTMPETMLKQLIARIDPNKKPVYVLLPESEYRQLKKAWRLP